MTKSSTSSSTAHAVLMTAAIHDRHLASPPDHLPAAAKHAVVQSLLKSGLLKEIEADVEGPAWRTSEDGEHRALRATAAGLAAVAAQLPVQSKGGSVEPAPDPASEGQHPPRTGPHSDAGGAAPVSTVGHPGTIRRAAEAVLSAWDDPDLGRPALHDAIQVLRAAVTNRESRLTRAASNGPRQNRSDTKRANVLALLQRPEGATVAQVADATGWMTHTVRGFFAGLKKAGVQIDVLERVKQVGPGKQGAKGSYTVYRVIDAG